MAGYLLKEDNRLVPLITLPFLRQRPYWRFPSGKVSSRRYPPELPATAMLE